ncbi:MAG: ABC transporter ATP-binding protein [Methanomicrobiales archaeon]|nr:ABC transporter ATP-binding protein [Methanomicrobiales archaeon]
MLEIDRINVYYGALQVLWNVSLRIEKGELVTLVGSNGAGKSTLVGSIFGFSKVKGGRLLFEGEEITNLPTYDVVKKGLAMVPERRELFPKMTVYENLILGSYIKGTGGDLAYVYELFPLLKEREAQLAGTLSGGEQQMLAIARSLMAEPKLLVLDEPSLGLSPKLVLLVLETVKRLNQEGLTILLVEQNIRHALEISTRAYILEGGRIIKAGPARDLLEDKDVRESYLGM